MSAYRPAALELETSSYKSSSNFSPPFLYDVPTISPPTSPTSSHLISPTSPSFPPPRSARAKSPRSPRNRSLTPIGVARSDLEQFAEQCRNWYFSQDETAGRLMTQTMASLPQSQRAPYSRLQAAIRSAYHRSINVRKTAEFLAHLSGTTSGGSMAPNLRIDAGSKAARKERYERFHQFIRTWCTMGMPGPQPFFQGLWAVMRLQVLPANLGGAGKCRIEWEIDDAVFKESGGKDFMVDAIDVLKGVLAFEEAPVLRPLTPSRTDNPSDTVHARAISQPLPSVTSIPQPKRARAPSDPFLDNPPTSRSLGASNSPSSGTILTHVAPDKADLESVSRLVEESTTAFSMRSELLYDDGMGEDGESLRIWTSPNFANAEYLDLLELFPSFVSQRTLPRFSAASKSNTDVEEGLTAHSQNVRYGTGSISLSSKERLDGWEGTWLTRFIAWFRRTFC